MTSIEEKIANKLLRRGNWHGLLELQVVQVVYKGWWWNRRQVGYQAVVTNWELMYERSGVHATPLEAVTAVVGQIISEDDMDICLEFEQEIDQEDTARS
jgi:hypothetical protein